MNKPVWKEKMGSISAAAWNNTRKSANGGTYEQTTVQIERRYQDSKGDWQSSSSYSLAELHALHHLTRRLIDRMVDDDNRQQQAIEASA
jgi:Zn/Cd-binding protein ZinT